MSVRQGYREARRWQHGRLGALRLAWLSFRLARRDPYVGPGAQIPRVPAPRPDYDLDD